MDQVNKVILLNKSCSAIKSTYLTTYQLCSGTPDEYVETVSTLNIGNTCILFYEHTIVREIGYLGTSSCRIDGAEFKFKKKMPSLILNCNNNKLYLP